MWQILFLDPVRNRRTVMLMKALMLALLLALSLPGIASAHPGNTDASGCHTCRTNCSNWGLSYGEYHCHNAKSWVQPEDPIRSHYGEYGTGYTEPWPAYEYSGGTSYTSTPSCPSLSTYDSFSGDCKCISGYIVSNGSCISGNSYCYSKHGYSSSYNSSTKSCECSYGYKLDSSGQCTSPDTLCHNQVGYSSSYDSLTDTCKCDSGYLLDSTGQCKSASSICSNQLGIMSQYNRLSKKCECMSGYIYDGSSCVYQSSNSAYPASAASAYSTYSAASSCPLNSHVNPSDSNKCLCDTGFQVNATGDACVVTPVISNNQACSNTYGANSRWDGTKTSDGQLNCGCQNGYTWNEMKTACVSITTTTTTTTSSACPPNSTGSGVGNMSCECNAGYVIQGTRCVLASPGKPGITSGTVVVPTPEVTSFKTTLRIGSSGDEVRLLQTLLSKLGHFQGDVTGYYGAKTKAAVSVFQKQSGMDPVGIVGPKTRALLNTL